MGLELASEQLQQPVAHLADEVRAQLQAQLQLRLDALKLAPAAGLEGPLEVCGSDGRCQMRLTLRNLYVGFVK